MDLLIVFSMGGAVLTVVLSGCDHASFLYLDVALLGLCVVCVGGGSYLILVANQIKSLLLFFYFSMGYR